MIHSALSEYPQSSLASVLLGPISSEDNLPMKGVFAERETERTKLCSNGELSKIQQFSKCGFYQNSPKLHCQKEQLIFLHIYNTYYFIYIYIYISPLKQIYIIKNNFVYTAHYRIFRFWPSNPRTLYLRTPSSSSVSGRKERNPVRPWFQHVL